MDYARYRKWMRRAWISASSDHRWRSSHVKAQWIGSRSGGAYADLTKLGPNSVVYSFGIATEISFDRAIIKETGANVWGFDPDPRCTEWLHASGRWVPPNFHFQEIALGAESGQFAFHMTDLERMTGSLEQAYTHGENILVQCKTLEEIMISNGHERVDYLKMDIEGAEYKVLSAWLKDYNVLPVRQLWLEFHPSVLGYSEKDSEALVRQLVHIGMVPGYRDYFRCPNNILMINQTLIS